MSPELDVTQSNFCIRPRVTRSLRCTSTERSAGPIRGTRVIHLYVHKFTGPPTNWFRRKRRETSDTRYLKPVGSLSMCSSILRFSCLYLDGLNYPIEIHQSINSVSRSVWRHRSRQRRSAGHTWAMAFISYPVDPYPGSTNLRTTLLIVLPFGWINRVSVNELLLSARFRHTVPSFLVVPFGDVWPDSILAHRVDRVRLPWISVRLCWYWVIALYIGKRMLLQYHSLIENLATSEERFVR